LRAPCDSHAHSHAGSHGLGIIAEPDGAVTLPTIGRRQGNGGDKCRSYTEAR
jgi:hypothetical protein